MTDKNKIEQTPESIFHIKINGVDHISICDFLDPLDLDHCDAYGKYVTTGEFPKGFLPSNILMSDEWETIFRTSMVSEWLSLMASAKRERERTGNVSK